MLTTLQGTYDNGVVVFDEKPPVEKKVKVLITFMEEVELPTEKKVRKAGGLAGQVWMADDFNEPLDDLREYMQ